MVDHSRLGNNTDVPVVNPARSSRWPLSVMVPHDLFPLKRLIFQTALLAARRTHLKGFGVLPDPEALPVRSLLTPISA
jgi:hypothetical protein